MKKKEKAIKISFKQPSFINSDGVIITTSLGVNVPKNKNGEYMIEQALREFKRIVKESGILDEYKDRREFKKPSARRRKQHQDACRMSKLKKTEENI